MNEVEYVARIKELLNRISLLIETDETENSLHLKDGYVVNDRESLITLMKDLHTIHWEYIDQQSISFNRGRFVRFCISNWEHQYVNFGKLYNKFKNLEKKIPCSYALILDPTHENILLIRHHESDLWSLPGGKLEPGEEFMECLKRELDEEIGLSDDIQVFDYMESRVNKRKVRCYKMNMSINHEFQTNSPFEIAEIKWYKIAELPAATKLLAQTLKMMGLSEIDGHSDDSD